MRHALIFAATALAWLNCAKQGHAQDAEDSPEEPEFHCDQPDLPPELGQLCASMSDGYLEAMSRPLDSPGFGRAPVRPSLARRPVTHEITGRGLVSRQIDRAKNPLDGPDERGVGVRLRAQEAPLQFSTEMVQPGAAGDTALNWELKAERAPETSGLFFGGATGGSYRADGWSENVSGFAGVRGIARPADNVSLAAEIAPRVGVYDFVEPQGSVSLEPKLTAKSDLGQLGTSGFVGSINADASYRVPIQGNAAAWGGFRFTVKPK